jgi:osmotically-inducible protein OsmY
MSLLHSELAVRISDALLHNERTRRSQIDVMEDNGVVTISGVANSGRARLAAAAIAAKIDGVLSVTNDLAVGEPSTPGEPRVQLVIPGHVNT